MKPRGALPVDDARSPRSGIHPWRIVGATVLALSLAIAVIGTDVPAHAMGWLRVHVPGFAPMWDQLDATFPALNPLHIIAYAWLALLWGILAPMRWWLRGGIGLIAIGAVAEAMQLFIPGRQARVTDALNDVLGVAIGLGIAALLRRARWHD